MSTSWNDGYVTDLAYTHGYYGLLSPVHAAHVLATAGFAAPKVETACELGFGQGVSVAVHGAAQAGSVDWWGTDFNPAQALEARALAGDPARAARLYDDAFAEFAARSDLPDFDFIGLHGIWSWVSDKNRAVLVDFVRRKLKLGGVLYISYNTQPGWSVMAPVRQLMKAHADMLGAKGQGSLARASGAIAFVDKLFETNPVYLRANPEAKARFEKLKTLDPTYVAHEYLNDEWRPMLFPELAALLGPAKVDFVGSANLIDHVDAFNLTPQMQALLEGISDPVFKETVRDYMVNRQFRSEYWVRGARRLTPNEHAAVLGERRVALINQRDAVKLKARGSAGEVTLSPEVYNPILDGLADHKPRTVSEIATLGGATLTARRAAEAISSLMALGALAAVQDEAAAKAARSACRAFNDGVLERARSSGAVLALASPLTGGGIGANRQQQLFLLATKHGAKSVQEQANFAWNHFARAGQKLVKDGKALESVDDNVAELIAQAEKFAAQRAPIFTALGVV